MKTEEQLRNAYNRLCELNPTGTKSVGCYLSNYHPDEFIYSAILNDQCKTGISVADAMKSLEASITVGVAEERRRAKEKCEELGMTVLEYKGEF